MALVCCWLCFFLTRGSFFESSGFLSKKLPALLVQFWSATRSHLLNELYKNVFRFFLGLKWETYKKMMIKLLIIFTRTITKYGIEIFNYTFRRCTFYSFSILIFYLQLICWALHCYKALQRNKVELMKWNFQENAHLQFEESTHKISVITVSKAFVIGP